MFAFDHFLLKKTVIIFIENMLAMLNKLLQRVGPRATKADSSWRENLQPGLKLTVTLKYLAPGDKYPVSVPCDPIGADKSPKTFEFVGRLLKDW